MITGKNYIGFDLSNAGSTTFKTFNPKLNKETEWLFYEASEEEIDKATALAWKAFHEFKTTSYKKRVQFLKKIADEIEQLGDELIKTYCEETGLPEGRAKGERGRTCFQLRTFAAYIEQGTWVNATIDTAIPNREPAPKPDLRKMSIPIGPIAVFGASNFPLAYSTAGGDTASALASGCPVIVKSHPMHAGTGELVASAIVKAARETNMPNGVFSNLNSSGIEVGQQLVAHSLIKGVGFTGSITGGRALFDLASRRKEPIPVFAEMGSINPVVLLPMALKTKGIEWAKAYASSITLGTGQFCTNPGLLLGIKSPDLSSFLEVLSKEISEIEPSCMLHPNIATKYDGKSTKMVAENSVALAAERKGNVADNYARQMVVKVDGKSFIANPRLHEEVFGPFSMVVECEDQKELSTIISDMDGQLTGTIISEENEIDDYNEVVAAMQNRVGRLIFNGVPTGVEVCPSMQHGGPYPASTDSRFGAVGIHAIQRWIRPLSYQNWPNQLLPDALKDENPLGILRLVNGHHSTESI
ncbi:aldehyde dehydrogenase (NADP(+)) [Croceivirga thetidis]|uniref:Aldehyde dehydrogenase (NADP(+)) n=1 Tax=Croceivirga thetidis TaxID=2721623 RepID=A0ABX1GQC3_9FLAO|nr:aldehyde dehydrogenase (NADP(+)) [Croceivirga thetidis]NKI32094.1 aldehyde dehydrogenase (NADP(+)) [Croceivirga thetidis]